MFVRIARFEGGGGNWDDRISAVRQQIQSGRSGDRGASVVFCENEDDLRKADEFMNNMTPPSGTGQRVSVEMYEVAVDETM